MNNRYDVTQWPDGDAFDDIGRVINSIIADIKARQVDKDKDARGKPGAVIYIPPGDYRLRTQILVDISFLRIEGAGHGFASSSIRFNVPADQVSNLHELWPGGSRIMVDLPGDESVGHEARAAIRVVREGSPRLSSIEFVGFCIDGLHFDGEHPRLDPENTYVNGKTGILVTSANDSLRVVDMGFVYLEHALQIHNADALSVHSNFIAECGNCIELLGWGQACKITDNLVGAGFNGYSIYAENHGGMLIATNNVFPRGASSIHLHSVTRSNISTNRLHSFYPGMLRIDGDSSEVLVSSNHFLRDMEPWAPFFGIDNGKNDNYGLVRIEGVGHSIIGNHISVVLDEEQIKPPGAQPVVIHLVAGGNHYVATNHVVATNMPTAISESCFDAQVDALLNADGMGQLAVRHVRVDSACVGNTVMDSGREQEVDIDLAVNAFRPTPGPAGVRKCLIPGQAVAR